MSLIVLNSKGDDPEDFSNFMTEQIKFPADAEVCLVSSNINRRMMVDLEAQIAAGSNTLGFQLGHGQLLQNGTRDIDLYTPHAPNEVSIESKGKNFPIKVVAAAVGDEINEHLNDADKMLCSNTCRGWASVAAPGGAPFTFFCTPQVCEGAPQEGQVGEWIIGAPGANKINQGGNNNTTQLGGSVEPEGGAYVDWIKLKGTFGNGNFVDLEPLWNTHNGARVGTFNPNASNINIEHGGYNWRFRTDNTAPEEIGALRGGIFDNTIFERENIGNANSNINKLNGGTAYTVWWELSRVAGDGSATCNFYARKPGRKMVEGTNNDMDADTCNWARVALPATPGHINIGIRPVLDVTGANPVYCLEAYMGISDLPNNTWTTNPAACTAGGTAGKIIIADPLNQGTWSPTITGERLNFDLYRHLPIRMGTSSSNTEPRVLCNAIHHKTTELVAPMANPDLTNFSPFTFLLNNLSPIENALPAAQGGSWDKDCRQMLRKATLAKVLGFIGYYGKVAAAAMLPAATGLPADIDLGLTLPENLNLVVTLPDLPITGYYGNSSGDDAAGTLNLNSGGNSAAIIGVIPSGDRPYKTPAGGDRVGNHRGQFFAAPMENYICLNNPAPFSTSSLRVRITDALGNKPNILDSTSTITIKVKRRRSEVDFRQGGDPTVFPA